MFSLIVAALFAAAAQEPSPHNNTLHIWQYQTGESITFGRSMEPRKAHFHRRRDIFVVRDRFGVVQEVRLVYLDTSSSGSGDFQEDVNRELRFYSPSGFRLAVRLFLRDTGLQHESVGYRRTALGNEVRHVPLVVALNPDWRPSEPDFLHDEEERFRLQNLWELHFRGAGRLW